MVIDHDVHLHTFLSACCRDEKLTPARAVARAAEIGLKTLGFSDHVWDPAVPGASAWYRPQDLKHVGQIRRQIPADTQGVRVLVGCESEYCGDGKVGLSAESAQLFDYVLLPMSHFHMRGGFVRPEGVSAPKDLARLLIGRLREVVEIEFATGIAHPLLPCGFEDHADEILGLICDSELLDCFGRAAELGVSMELSRGMFPGCRNGQSEGFHDGAFVRIMSLAKQAGCFFHFGSDAHSLTGVGNVLQLSAYADQIGIVAADILPLFRP